MHLSNIIGAKMPTKDSEKASPSPANAQHAADYLHDCIKQERAAIAREIHDDIGGALAAIRFDLAWIGRHANDRAMQARAGAALEVLRHAIDASQRIAQDLQPAMLDQGLVAAVRWLADGFERRTGIKTQFSTTRERIDMASAVQLVAYRTVQEALTNIGKHAQCSAVSIELSASAKLLSLEIADNGQGVSRAALEKPSALGLKGLRERARTVGGRLDIGNRHGVGTAIVLSVPLRRPATAAPDQGPAA